MGMQVIAYNRSRHPEGEGIGEYVDLDTLLERSDMISLHCPLTAENAELICKDTLSKMKDGAILLNTARGGLLNEQDVADALRCGKLRYAAVDVVSKEPIDPRNPLLTAPNCIITPHMAWAPIESRQRLLDCTVRSIEGFLAGKPVNTVN
jgi:glycerate dehydrogenase